MPENLLFIVWYEWHPPTPLSIHAISTFNGKHQTKDPTKKEY